MPKNLATAIPPATVAARGPTTSSALPPFVRNVQDLWHLGHTHVALRADASNFLRPVFLSTGHLGVVIRAHLPIEEQHASPAAGNHTTFSHGRKFVLCRNETHNNAVQQHLTPQATCAYENAELLALWHRGTMLHHLLWRPVRYTLEVLGRPIPSRLRTDHSDPVPDCHSPVGSAEGTGRPDRAAELEHQHWATGEPDYCF